MSIKTQNTNKTRKKLARLTFNLCANKGPSKGVVLSTKKFSFGQHCFNLINSFGRWSKGGEGGLGDNEGWQSREWLSTTFNCPDYTTRQIRLLQIIVSMALTLILMTTRCFSSRNFLTDTFNFYWYFCREASLHLLNKWLFEKGWEEDLKIKKIKIKIKKGWKEDLKIKNQKWKLKRVEKKIWK